MRTGVRNWGAGPVSPSLGPTGLRHPHYELKLHHSHGRRGAMVLRTLWRRKTRTLRGSDATGVCHQGTTVGF